MHPSMPLEDARAICDRLGIVYEAGWGAGKLMAEVFEATAEASLNEPTFVLDHPREISPLARAHRDDPCLTERFEAYVGGRELANAYSELNDPVDQRERFEAEGFVDEGYVRALEYGLPPTGGLGIGIDRLVMLIAGVSSIRDAVLFPALRPEPRPEEAAPVVVAGVSRRGGTRGAATTAAAGAGRADRPRRARARARARARQGRPRPVGGRRRAADGARLRPAGGPAPGLGRGGRALRCDRAAAALRPAVLMPAVALLVTLVWHRQAFAVGARRSEPAATVAERERARALVLEHGTGTLDYFALRPDKRYFFTGAGDAMLAYRCTGGHALVSGDPIGAPAAFDRLLREFLEHCREHGRRVAFLGAREADLPLYRRHGLRAIYLGDEAVVRSDTFTPAHKSVRAAVTRVGRECTFRLLRETDAPGFLRDA